jgi:predicted RNase H-like HicB family nuclease
MTEPTLKLTGLIYKGDTPGVFIGCIKEMLGVVVQGNSEDAVYRDLVEGAKFLMEFKHEEALNLLRQQINTEYATDEEIGFSLKREVIREAIAE